MIPHGPRASSAGFFNPATNKVSNNGANQRMGRNGYLEVLVEDVPCKRNGPDPNDYGKYGQLYNRFTMLFGHGLLFE